MIGSAIDAKLGFLYKTINMLQEEDRTLALHQLSLQLEKKNLNEIPPELARRGISFKMPLDERRRLLGREEPAKVPPGRLDQWLTELAGKDRVQTWAWRTGQEIHEHRDWYTFFVTLTIDPSKVPDARSLMVDGIEWRRYRTRVAEVARKACGYKQRSRGGPKVPRYFRYVAVCEHGKKRTHHHIHALLLLRDIPELWKRDPNRSRSNKNATDVMSLKSMWPWATVTKASPFRFIGDSWTRIGWAVPLVRGKTMQLSSPEQSGYYLFKYVGKEEREWNHRTKSTRGFGLRRIREEISRLTLTQAIAAACRPWCPPSRQLMRKCNVPLTLLRREARWTVLASLWKRTVPVYRTLMKWLTRPRLRVYAEMRRSVAAGAQPWQMDCLERTDWFTGIAYHPAESVSSEALVDLWTHWTDVFGKQRTRPVGALAGYSL